MRDTSAAARALRIVHTVRYLKPAQIYARVLKKISRIRPDPSPAPPLRAPVGEWTAPAPRPASVGNSAWRVRFLNVDGEIARPDQWNDQAKSKLWIYNLHYFDDLCASDASGRRKLQRRLIVRWIAENPPPQGNGWEPYPISLRIVNWIKWHLTGQPLSCDMRDSLAMQARWLAAHLEWHLLGNHILANAKALIFAGLFFSEPEADRWLKQGLAIYTRELPEQILADGAHFELSPMYHAIILEDVLDLINIARLYGRADTTIFAGLPDIAQRMRAWLSAMTHPDGGPAFFNDAAFGIAASRDEIEAYASRLGFSSVASPGEGVHHLAASGYVRVNLRDMTAILDVAAVGPDYIPGHAHADTLSFELSLGCERVIVNGGTSIYAPGSEREVQRATRAHSTVEIDGKNSSEVWGAFRVARRARVKDVVIEQSDHCIIVSAAHDGYTRLPGHPLHRRQWRFGMSRLVVQDDIRASRTPIPATAYFHLAAGVEARHSFHATTENDLVTPGGRTLGVVCGPGTYLLPDKWHREFGAWSDSKQIVSPVVGNVLATQFDWT